MNERKLAVTMTGELFQPARIYYKVFNRTKLAGLLRKLDCMLFDASGPHWVWLYTGKAKDLVFQKPRPLSDQPIVLGSFHLNAGGESWLDVRSFDRVVKAIPFFDRFIPRAVAEVTDVAVVNRCFAPQEGNLNFNEIFDPARLSVCDPDAVMAQIGEAAGRKRTQGDPAAVARLLETLMGESLPEVERFCSLYYEDGIAALEGALKLRRSMALDRWDGKAEASFADIIRRLPGMG